jgi:hypothetical protein
MYGHLQRGGDDNKASTASASSTRSVPPTGPASDTLPSPADNATAALKTKFEEAQRLAAQFNKTEFARAAEYYTECIDICNVVQVRLIETFRGLYLNSDTGVRGQAPDLVQQPQRYVREVECSGIV